MHYWGDYFKERTVIDNLTGCWEWKLYKTYKGYGRLTFNRKNYAAHRFSYNVFVGEIGGFHVCHKCDNPSCVNPDHLWLGTNRDNHLDKILKNRARYAVEFRNHNCKLSDQDVRVIYMLYNSIKISHRELGILFNINHRVIGRILSGEERSHAFMAR